MRRFAMIAVLSAFAACSGHPLEGAWNEDLAGGKKGMTLEFNTKGTECMVHTAPAADGSHDHVKGTYTFDEKSNALTVNARLLGADKSDAFTGTLGNGHIELSSADGKLKFEKGDGAHGH